MKNTHLKAKLCEMLHCMIILRLIYATKLHPLQSKLNSFIQLIFEERFFGFFIYICCVYRESFGGESLVSSDLRQSGYLDCLHMVGLLLKKLNLKGNRTEGTLTMAPN